MWTESFLGGIVFHKLILFVFLWESCIPAVIKNKYYEEKNRLVINDITHIVD